MNTNANTKRIIGIELLRTFLCFRVVLFHYYTSNNSFIIKLRDNRFQVPCFFFISFYFLYPIISKRNKEKKKLRLERLSIPYIIHAIVNWIINILQRFSKTIDNWKRNVWYVCAMVSL